MTPADAPRPNRDTGFDPADLDGHTLDELSDYLDAGCTPPDPSIDDSPACQMALDSLAEVRAAADALLRKEAETQPDVSESWIVGILAAISMNVRAGRSIPIAHPAATARLSVTEGAVRSLIRSAGDSVGGVLLGRCELNGDVAAPGAEVAISVELTVLWGQNIHDKADQVRAAIARAMLDNTELKVTSIDVIASDIHLPVDEGGESS